MHRLLADAIPLLCRSGLPLRPTFCIEALIGITLEDDEVMLISFKQEIHADENLSKDDFFSPASAAASKEAMTSRGAKTSYLPATKDKIDQTDDDDDDERGGKTTGKAFLGGKGGQRTVPDSSALPIVKMEDVEMNSSACGLHSELRDDFVTDSLSWNFHKYNTFPTADLQTTDTAYGDEEDCAGFVGQGSWKGDKRTSNKIGRKKTSQINNGSLSSEEHDHTSPPDVGIKEEWHWKRKDGRAGINPTASSNSTSVSFVGDVQVDGRLVVGPSAEAAHQDSVVNQSIADIQLTDDRVTLEQTCKILSSYRLAGSDDNLYSCHICEEKLRGRQTLNEHIRGTHLCAHTYRCSTCGMSFKWRSGLQRHRSRCTTMETSSTAETNVPKTHA